MYHESLDLGDSALLSLTLDTKNVRKAVAAVIVNAKFAAINCQYISQTESRDLTGWPTQICVMRVMVHIMVRIVMHREAERTIFCIRLTLILQISRKGINKT